MLPASRELGRRGMGEGKAGVTVVRADGFEIGRFVGHGYFRPQLDLELGGRIIAALEANDWRRRDVTIRDSKGA